MFSLTAMATDDQKRQLQCKFDSRDFVYQPSPIEICKKLPSSFRPVFNAQDTAEKMYDSVLEKLVAAKGIYIVIQEVQNAKFTALME